MQAGVLWWSEVDAYIGAVDWFRGVLGRTEVGAAWNEASAVAPYSVGGIAAHAVQGVMWLQQLLKDAEPIGLRALGLSEFYGLNRAEEGRAEDAIAGSLRSAAENFARTGIATVRAACTTARDELIGLLDEAPATRAVAVIRVRGGQVPLGEYLRTRVLEVVVHGDDLACSVPGLVVPDPPAASMDICLGVCVELSRARVGGLAALRAFTRVERSLPGALRVL